jgi:methylmalonyl-CoA mutase
MGLQGMINEMLARCDFDLTRARRDARAAAGRARARARARRMLITALENGRRVARNCEAAAHAAAGAQDAGARHHRHRRRRQVSLTDELIRRFRLDQGDG